MTQTIQKHLIDQLVKDVKAINPKDFARVGGELIEFLSEGMGVIEKRECYCTHIVCHPNMINLFSDDSSIDGKNWLSKKKKLTMEIGDSLSGEPDTFFVWNTTVYMSKDIAPNLFVFASIAGGFVVEKYCCEYSPAKCICSSGYNPDCEHEGHNMKSDHRGAALKKHCVTDAKGKYMKTVQCFAIVVLDRGFVYVGDVVHDGEWCVISNARNIRYWGTKKGLGQLALEGPQPETKLDEAGTVRAPAHSVISLIDTEADKWK